jgi:hypothetical protein
LRGILRTVWLDYEKIVAIDPPGKLPGGAGNRHCGSEQPALPNQEERRPMTAAASSLPLQRFNVLTF